MVSPLVGAVESVVVDDLSAEVLGGVELLHAVSPAISPRLTSAATRDSRPRTPLPGRWGLRNFLGHPRDEFLGDAFSELLRAVEPAGERLSQRELGGVGRFVDGCGPGDVGFGASQEGVGWSVIGFGGVDVDAMLSISGGFAEVRAVGQVEEDDSRRGWLRVQAGTLRKSPVSCPNCLGFCPV